MAERLIHAFVVDLEEDIARSPASGGLVAEVAVTQRSNRHSARLNVKGAGRAFMVI